MQTIKGVSGFIFIIATGIGFVGANLGLPWYTYLAYFTAVIAAASVKMIIIRDWDHIGGLAAIAVIIGISYAVMWFSSLYIWVASLQEMTYISRGISRILYQVIGIVYAASAAYLFGGKSARPVFYGLVFGNSCKLLQVIGQFGAGQFASDYLATVLSFASVETESMRAMEIHDVTFAFGIWCVYFLVVREKKRIPVIELILSVFFFLAGLKRIAIVSVAVVLACSLPVRLSGKFRSVCMAVLGAVQVFAAWGYLVFVKEGWLALAAEQSDVDTMGRLELYGMFSNMYDLGVRFIGFGMGYTSRLITNWFQTGVISHSFGSLHNDILTLYLELGFLGFAIWLVYETLMRYQLADMAFGKEVGIVFFLTGAYLFLTYFSDNTHFYAAVQASGYLAPMAAWENIRKKQQKEGALS